MQASQEEIEEMKKQINSISYEELHLFFDMLLKGEREMALCYDSELVLEVLLLRLCSAPHIEELAPLAFSKNNSSSFSTSSDETTFKTSPPLKQIPLEKPSIKSPLNQKPEIQVDRFEKSLDFLDYLKGKDQSLSALIENLSLKQKDSSRFYFIVPASFSYLKKKT